MADQKALKRRLKALMARPENQVCSDCPEKKPTWASLIAPPPGAPPGTEKIGAFCCLECSGSHRRLGVHISFVRSINLDSWKEWEVVAMEAGGNYRVNSIFEANLTVRKPSNLATGPERERFIRDKYERRKYFNGLNYTKNAAPPPPAVGGGGRGGAAGSSSARPGAPSEAARQRVANRQARMKSSQSGELPSSGGGGGSNSGRQAIASAPVSAPVTFDLLDFGGGAPAPAPAAPSAFGTDPFAAPVAAPPAAPAPTIAAIPPVPAPAMAPPPPAAAPVGGDFADFANLSAAPQGAQAPAAANAPAANKSNADIMALFGGASSAPSFGGMMPGGMPNMAGANPQMMGMNPQMMGGMGMNMSMNGTGVQGMPGMQPKQPQQQQRSPAIPNNGAMPGASPSKVPAQQGGNAGGMPGMNPMQMQQMMMNMGMMNPQMMAMMQNMAKMPQQQQQQQQTPKAPTQMPHGAPQPFGMNGMGMMHTPAAQQQQQPKAPNPQAQQQQQQMMMMMNMMNGGGANNGANVANTANSGMPNGFGGMTASPAQPPAGGMPAANANNFNHMMQGMQQMGLNNGGGFSMQAPPQGQPMAQTTSDGFGAPMGTGGAPAGDAPKGNDPFSALGGMNAFR